MSRGLIHLMNNMPSERQITEAIERILRRREFAGAGYEPQGVAIPHEAGRSLSQILESLGGLGLAVMIALVAVILIGLAWLIYSERRRRVVGSSASQQNRPTATADPFLHAAELARAEDWAGALQILYALHLSNLHAQGWVEKDESKTGLQYMWELNGKGYDDVAGFDAFRKVFNRVRYGGYPELRETYERFNAYCRAKQERRRAA